jgi:hypothetical protein
MTALGHSGHLRRSGFARAAGLFLLLVLPLPAAHWEQLFNHRDLRGWRHVGGGSFEVKNGQLCTHAGLGLLYWTGGPIGRARLRVVYRMERRNANSGVYVRIPLEPREEWMPIHYGYEIQINNEPRPSPEQDTHLTGCLYTFTRALARPGKPGPEWNIMEITLDGPRTIVEVNGVKVTDFTEGTPVAPRATPNDPQRGPRPLQGWFGLQNHGRKDKDMVWFNEIAIERE